MSDEQKLRKRLERRIDALPVLPTVVSKLMMLDQDQEDYFEEVLALVESDPTFAARILAACNAAADGPRSRITSVRPAFARLGSAEVASMILTVGVSRMFIPRGDWEKSLWRHSLQVAIVLRNLVKASPRAQIQADEAYTAGLLHDIGRFVLFGEAPKALRRIDEGHWETREELIKQERAICGMTHPEIGAVACQRWKLPELLVSVVRRHHDNKVDPSHGEVETLICAVRFADVAMFRSSVPGAKGYEEEDAETIEAELIPKLPDFFDCDAQGLLAILQTSAVESASMCRAIGLS